MKHVTAVLVALWLVPRAAWAGILLVVVVVRQAGDAIKGR